MRVYLIYTRLPRSGCLRSNLDEGVRTHLGNTRQGQVKDQCLSLIYYLWCCVLGLRVTLRVIEHPLVLSTCEIGSTPKTLQMKWFP